MRNKVAETRAIRVKAGILLFWIGAGVLSAAAHGGTLAEYEVLEKSAKAGDYQAQRNVAYWLSGGNGGSPPLNPISPALGAS